MQLKIYSLTKKGFQRLENFCNRAGIEMKYLIDRNIEDLYDISISSIECQAIFRTSIVHGEELIVIQDFKSSHTISIRSYEFFKAVII